MLEREVKEGLEVKNQPMMKIFLTLILSTAYIFSFSHLAAFAYDRLVHQGDVWGQGTKIGSINVSGKTSQQVALQLEQAVKKWTSENRVTFTYKEKNMKVDNSMFQFRNEETIGRLKSGQKNLAAVKLDQNKLEDAVYDTSISLSSQKLDFDKLSQDLLVSAAMLEGGQYTFHLENYVSGSSKEHEVITKAEIKAGKDEKELKEIVKRLGKTEIHGQTQFSLLNTLKNAKAEKFSSDALSRVASGIYRAILPTNFAVVERNISRELPSYARLGYEARADTGNDMDLVVANMNDTAYSLYFSVRNHTLIVTLKGQAFLNKYSILEMDKKKYPPSTVQQFSALLSTGERTVKEQGKDGQEVKIVRKIFNESGKLVKTEQISDDFYPPVQRVEVSSLAEPAVIPGDDGTTVPAAGDGTIPAADPNTVPSADQNTVPSDPNTVPQTGTDGVPPADSSNQNPWNPGIPPAGISKNNWNSGLPEGSGAGSKTPADNSLDSERKKEDTLNSDSEKSGDEK
jgi:hypothetical protein